MKVLTSIRVLFGIMLLSVLVPSNGSAQASTQADGNCGWCDSSFWFTEHGHGWVEQLRENRQYHSGGPYPGKCPQAHAACGSSDLALTAIRLDATNQSHVVASAEVKEILEGALQRGIAVETIPVGIRLSTACGDKAETVVIVVPLRPQTVALTQAMLASADEE